MLLAQCAVGDGNCQEDRGEGTEYHTQNHGEGEGADAVTTKEEDAEEYEERRQGRHYRTRQTAIDGVVEETLRVALGIEAHVLANTVEDYHGIVDGVTNDRQDSCDKGLIHLHGEGKDLPQQGVE